MHTLVVDQWFLQGSRLPSRKVPVITDPGAGFMVWVGSILDSRITLQDGEGAEWDSSFSFQTYSFLSLAYLCVFVLKAIREPF